MDTPVRHPRRVRVPGPFRYRDLPDGVAYIGRNCFGYPRSEFANPYDVKRLGLTEALRLYSALPAPGYVIRAAEVIGNHRAACWCRLDSPCHGDVLLAAIDRGATTASYLLGPAVTA